MYYNARHYDPTLGTFVSPDSMVPGAGQVINYNRFLYARGNPLKFSDPSGYIPDKPAGPTVKGSPWEEEFCWNNRWYLAHGYGWDGNHWSKPIQAQFLDKEILTDVLKEAGIEIDSTWKDLDPGYDNLSLLGQGVVAFAKRIEKIPNHRKINGLVHLDYLIDGREKVKWRRLASASSGLCINLTHVLPACAWNDGVEFYDKLFDGSNTPEQIVAMAVHEMAHKIHFEPVFKGKCGGGGGPRCDISRQAAEFLKNGYALTAYVAGPTWWVEYWSEAVSVWVFREDPPDLIPGIDADYLIDVFDWVAGIAGP